jgi:hypothetical protein
LEFDQMGSFKETQDESGTEGMEELASLLRLKGEKTLLPKLPLALLAGALQDVRETRLPKDSEEFMPTVQFAYRWRANARMRKVSRSVAEAADEPASQAPEGAVAPEVVAAPAAASGSATSGGPGREVRRHAARTPPRQHPGSPRASLQSSPRSTRSCAASAREPFSPARTLQPVQPREPCSPSSRGSRRPARPDIPAVQPREPSSPSRHSSRPALPDTPAVQPSRYSLGTALYSLRESADSEDAILRLELLQQALGPITPKELQASTPTVPLRADDLPPTFERSGGCACDQSKGSHYEYFRRLRDHNQQQVHSARRAFNYRLDPIRAGTAPTGGELSMSLPSSRLASSGKPSSAPHSARAPGVRMSSTR